MLSLKSNDHVFTSLCFDYGGFVLFKSDAISLNIIFK